MAPVAGMSLLETVAAIEAHDLAVSLRILLGAGSFFAGVFYDPATGRSPTTRYLPWPPSHDDALDGPCLHGHDTGWRLSRLAVDGERLKRRGDRLIQTTGRFLPGQADGVFIEGAVHVHDVDRAAFVAKLHGVAWPTTYPDWCTGKP